MEQVLIKSATLPKPCEYCGKEFKPERISAKFCSNACRTKAYRSRHGIPNPDFNKLVQKKPQREEERYLSFLQEELDALLIDEMNSEAKYKTAQNRYEQALDTYQSSLNHWSRENTQRRKKEVDQLRSELFDIQVKKTKLQKKIEDYQKYIDKEVLEKSQLIMSSDEIVNLKFESLDLGGDWQSLFGEPSTNFGMIIYGEANSGKSIFALRLANKVKDFGRVIYFAIDEKIGITIQKKILDNNIRGIDLSMAKNKREMEYVIKKGDYNFIFIDSASKVHITTQDLLDIKKKFPDKALITIFELSRAQDIFGAYNYTQFCDILIRIEKGKAYSRGKFAVDGEFQFL